MQLFAPCLNFKFTIRFWALDRSNPSVIQYYMFQSPTSRQQKLYFVLITKLRTQYHNIEYCEPFTHWREKLALYQVLIGSFLKCFLRMKLRLFHLSPSVVDRILIYKPPYNTQVLTNSQTNAGPTTPSTRQMRKLTPFPFII